MMNLLLAETNAGSTWILLALLVVALVVMFVLPMFTNKKRVKEYNEMVEALSAGDEILTVGGIMGKIVKVVKENGQAKSVIIATGEKGKETTMEIEISHIKFLLGEPQAKKSAETEEVKAEKEEKFEPQKTDSETTNQNNEEKPATKANPKSKK